MACSKCNKQRNLIRERMPTGRALTKPGVSQNGPVFPHQITEKQGIRKQAIREQKRELRRGIPSKGNGRIVTKRIT